MRHSGDRGSRRACIALRRCVSAPPDGPFISSPWRTASVRTVRYTYHQQYCSDSMPRRFVPGFSGPRRCRHLTWLRLHRCIYPILSPPAFVVASIHCCCCISRSSSVHRFYYHPTHRNSRLYPYPYSRPFILVPPLVCFTISGGPISTRLSPQLASVLVCKCVFKKSECLNQAI